MSRYTIERENLLQVIADRIGKPTIDLITWVDYDPIMIDDEIRALSQPAGIRWTGD